MSNPSGTSIDENGPAATGARAAPKRKATPRKPKIDADAPRANRSRAVAELLPAIGGAAFRRFGFVQSSVVSRWPEIVGERFAGVSTPESIRFPMGQKQDGVLTLTVRGAHAPMMQHVIPEITERVNRFFGYAAVARITIRQGEVARPRVKASSEWILDCIAHGGDIYGVTTGFGGTSHRRTKDGPALQVELLR